MSHLAELLNASRSALNGHLPQRYRTNPWRYDLEVRLAELLHPGMTILDVGSGRKPVVPLPSRPDDCTYVGLDVSKAELDLAPAGSYDEITVCDVMQHVPELEERFDVIVSCQVLEHVARLPVAVENLHRYLKPGGTFLAQLSGSFSVYGILNRILPQAVSGWLMERLLHRPRDSVFTAYYDGCWYSRLRAMMQGWSKVTIEPLWLGAGYFVFSRSLVAAYVGYEEWVRLSNRLNLAPYYLVEAVK